MKKRHDEVSDDLVVVARRTRSTDIISLIFAVVIALRRSRHRYRWESGAQLHSMVP